MQEQKGNEQRLIRYKEVLKTRHGPCETCEAVLNEYGLASLKDEVSSIVE